jgi:hypothetical protein
LIHSPGLSNAKEHWRWPVVLFCVLSSISSIGENPRRSETVPGYYWRMRSWLFAWLAALSISAATACHSSVDESMQISAAEAQRLLSQSPWLDHMPADHADSIDLFQFDSRGQGVYVHGSQYRGSYELFHYEATREELRMVFLDGGAKAKTRYRIERMKRGGFDLRLTFSDSPRGPSAYYGFDNRRELPAEVSAVLPVIR